MLGEGAHGVAQGIDVIAEHVVQAGQGGAHGVSSVCRCR